MAAVQLYVDRKEDPAIGAVEWLSLVLDVLRVLFCQMNEAGLLPDCGYCRCIVYHLRARHHLMCRTSFISHIKHLKEKCTKALNLLRVIAHTTWGADQQTLLHLYRALIRSKLDYGCIVYGSARISYLRMLDPIQNHALRLCLGAYRTSPSSSLCVLANEPPLHLRRQKLSIQYCLRLSSTSQNPAYSAVFNSKFKPSFQRKPNQIPPLGIRIQSHLQSVLPYQHRLGSSTVLKSTSAYTLFIKMILHLKSSGITSMSCLLYTSDAADE